MTDKRKDNKGRPTKCTPQLIEMARGYIINYGVFGDVIPSIAGLAVVLGIRRETLQVWKKEDGQEEITEILHTILAKQENELVNRGLDGTFSSVITKLALGKHGYHEKQDRQLSGAVETQFIFTPVGPNDESD